MVNSFVNGKTIDELSEKFNLTKVSVRRHLKKELDLDIFKNLSKNNKEKSDREFKDELPIEFSNEEEILNTETNQLTSFKDPSFVEIMPLNLEIDSEPQKDLSSISISEIDLPKIVYILVNNKIELETKLLGDYADWQFLSQTELKRKTIEIFFDLKVAKRFCGKDQKVLKVPNTNVFKIVAPILISRGISRIISPDKLIAL